MKYTKSFFTTMTAPVAFLYLAAIHSGIGTIVNSSLTATNEAQSILQDVITIEQGVQKLLYDVNNSPGAQAAIAATTLSGGGVLHFRQAAKQTSEPNNNIPAPPSEGNTQAQQRPLTDGQFPASLIQPISYGQSPGGTGLQPAQRFNGIIDLSHWQGLPNGSADFLSFAKAGIAAIFLKATQGVGDTDSAFHDHYSQATAAGISRVGAYHFLTNEDVPQQIAFFIAAAKEITNLAIDIEPNGDRTPTIQNAELAVQLFEEKTGRSPLLYMGPFGVVKQPSPILNRCPLWVSDYGNNENPRLPPGFQGWKLRQYTQTAQFLGLGNEKFDRSYFNGAKQDFLAWWDNQFQQNAPTRSNIIASNNSPLTA